jgi:hypothetical protein
MLDTDRSSVVDGTANANPQDREVDTRSTDELEEEIAELCTHIDAATYRLLRAIAEFDRHEAWGWGFRSTAHWLTWRVGIDLVTAREKVRVARALEGLSQISDTFRQGKVSYSKVRAMTRIATPENEGYLLYIAENGTASEVETLVRAYRRAYRGEDLEEARRQRKERYLDMYTDEDGMVVIRGRLPQEVAALLEKALEAAMDALKQEERGRDDSAESLEGSMTIEAGGLPRRPRSWQCPKPDAAQASDIHDSAESWRGESFAQRRVDALGFLAEAALANGLGRSERGEPYQVMIHVDSAILADLSHDGLCETENGDGISAETCRRLACDAPYVTVSQKNEGNFLHIGRKARKISVPLWRALISRDRTCQFPGCNRRRHLQAHHIEHWAKGGETNPENLVLLCRTHHWAVHEGGVRVERRVPQGLVFHRPDGHLLPVCPVPVTINGKAGETLKEANRRQGLEITAKTVDCFWDGERMDCHMAVDALMTYDDDPSDDE